MTFSSEELKNIETLLTERLKVDYKNYNEEFFRRRLSYLFERMALRRVEDLNTVMASLVKFDEITYYMAVPSTEMFRAPSFWRAFTHIIEGKKQLHSIWMPDLTSYHELYSLLIALRIAGRTDCSIVANVLSDKITSDVQHGRLSSHDYKDDASNFERLESQFAYDDFVTLTDDGPFLKPELLSNVTFRNGWFLNQPNNEFYDVILFRNTLLSYNLSLHRKAVKMVVDSLSRTGAMLCLGTMERPLGSEDELSFEFASEGIFCLK